jgi:uncharacterized membrane protein
LKQAENGFLQYGSYSSAVSHAGSLRENVVGQVEEIFYHLSADMALCVEAASVVIIFFASMQALVRAVASLFQTRGLHGKREIWARYAVWLLLGLEFLLASDIIRTAIAPTWTDIGQLAAVAVIRTFLNYFLTKDIETIGT